MTLLWDAPIWWDQFDQTLWWAFMQIACSAVAHTHAKRPLLTIALFENEDCVPPKEICIKQALINRGYLLSIFIAHLSKVSDLINQIMIHRKCNGSIAVFFFFFLPHAHAPLSPIFPLTFFWKHNGIYTWSLFLRLKDRKNSIFGKIFILLYFQITCYRDATHVCFHISISVIIHHQTLTGWKFYEERKHQPRAYYRFTPRESSIKRITRIVSPKS